MTIDRSHGADEGYVIGREPIVVKLNPRVVVETLIGPAPIDVDRLARALRVEAHNLYARDDAQRRAMAEAIVVAYLEDTE